MDKTLFHALKGYLHRCLDREINGMLPGGGRRFLQQRATRAERRAMLSPKDIEISEIPLIEDLLQRLEAEAPIDTSDIPEAGEEFFANARLVLPKE